MPKSLLIRPEDVRASGVLSFSDIPLNAYQKNLKDVKADFPVVDLVNLHADMRLIREFETMLAGIRTVKTYNGIEYSYTGPAHLSIGQEASAVGQAYTLDLNDFTFGTHRSHGEVLARAFMAIRQLGENNLYEIMVNFRNGVLLRKVESFSPYIGNIRELAFDHLDAPPVALGSHNWISPCPELEKFFFPQKEWVLDAIDAKILKLNGHIPTCDMSGEEKLRCEKLGI